MDVLLVVSSVYDLPSSQRVGAILYDGAADLKLWPGRGGDRDIQDMYGPGLKAELDVRRAKLGAPELPLGGVVRLHPGKLHCDFLAWVATRPPERGTEREPAPGPDLLTSAVQSALSFVAERNVLRVAIPALGGGPGELERAHRLELIVKAAHKYEESCFAAGRAPVVEEVLVCEPHGGIMSDVRRRVARLAKDSRVVKSMPQDDDERPTRAQRTRQPSQQGMRPSSRPRRGAPRLEPEEIAQARVMAPPYDRAHKYAEGEWLLHPRFGAGKVSQLTPEGAMVVLFEDGEQRKMIHAR